MDNLQTLLEEAFLTASEKKLYLKATRNSSMENCGCHPDREGCRHRDHGYHHRGEDRKNRINRPDLSADLERLTRGGRTEEKPSSASFFYTDPKIVSTTRDGRLGFSAA